jgi:hypothetical protein
MNDTQKNDVLYLQAHGLAVAAPEKLNKALALAIDQMHRSLYGESATELPAAEASVLQAGGFDLNESTDKDPLAETATVFAALLTTGLSAKGAAERLGVQDTRIRQMLTERTLYGFHINHRWQIPEFQFAGNALVPNIGKVNAVLDPDLHPVAVYQWYITPNVDLEMDDQPLSPLAWLKAGYPVEPVVQSAAEI